MLKRKFISESPSTKLEFDGRNPPVRVYTTDDGILTQLDFKIMFDL